MMFRTTLMIAALAAATPAFAANIKASKTCAAALSPEGKMMYDAAAPNVKPDSEMRDVIRSGAIGLVMTGKLNREQAQANGPAVAGCLSKLK
jgi:hypothetical protein